MRKFATPFELMFILAVSMMAATVNVVLWAVQNSVLDNWLQIIKIMTAASAVLGAAVMILAMIQWRRQKLERQRDELMVVAIERIRHVPERQPMATPAYLRPPNYTIAQVARLGRPGHVAARAFPNGRPRRCGATTVPVIIMADAEGEHNVH
jgi:hypothetical protein